MISHIVNDLAEFIRRVDGDNKLPAEELSAALANHLIDAFGHERVFASDVVEFVERTNPDKAMGAGQLAELIVAEFQLDEGV